MVTHSNGNLDHRFELFGTQGMDNNTLTASHVSHCLQINKEMINGTGCKYHLLILYIDYTITHISNIPGTAENNRPGISIAASALGYTKSVTFTDVRQNTPNYPQTIIYATTFTCL